MISFAVQVDILPLVYFCFCFFVFGVRFKTSSPKLVSSCLLPMFSFRTFMVSSLKLKSLIDFDLNFMYGVRQWSSFIFCMRLSRFPNTRKEEAILSPLYILHSFVINWLYLCGFISGLLILFCWSVCLFSCQLIVLITVTVLIIISL